MKPVIPEVKTEDEGITRRTEVLASEGITTPAGTFPCIRILATGFDGDLALRRIVWFAPGHGIIREEGTRTAATSSSSARPRNSLGEIRSWGTLVPTSSRQVPRVEDRLQLGDAVGFPSLVQRIE